MSRKTIGLVAGTVLSSVLALNAQVISGSVKDALNGQPIAGAAVFVVEASKTFTSDGGGKFNSDTLAKGSYTVRAEAAGYLKQSKTIILATLKQVGSDHVIADFSLFSLQTNVEASKGTMSVKYFFPGHADVEITITDSVGKTIRKVFDRSRAGGTREFSWDGKNNDGKSLPPGTYTCKLTSRNLVSLRTLTLQGENTGTLSPRQGTPKPAAAAPETPPPQEPASVSPPPASGEKLQ